MMIKSELHYKSVNKLLNVLFNLIQLIKFLFYKLLFAKNKENNIT